jgi:NADPH-dependent 2,4-dienoyl-CoA reductase/sulfur reductase-like enzyme
LARRRHVIVGGGTAAINAIATIREIDRGASEIALVADERPYSRMVLPYFLGGRIGRQHVFTLAPRRLAELGVDTAALGRRAVALDSAAQRLELDDGTRLAYDDLLVATGSRPALPPIPGVEGPGVHPFWTLAHADALLGEIGPGSEVAMVGAGFIAFTILGALLRRGVRLTLLEAEPRILPHVVDAGGAELVTEWLLRHGVRVRAGVRLASIETADGRRRLTLAGGERLAADVAILATGVHPNLEWLRGSGVLVSRGIPVDEHLRSSVPRVYAAGDVALAIDRVTGERALFAIEPAAAEQGRVAGANLAGRETRYPGTLSMNVVDVQGLEIASFGAWDDPAAESAAVAREAPRGYRRLLFGGGGDRLTGAILVGHSRDVWTTHDVGMLKGLVQSGAPVGAWKRVLLRDPWEVRRAFVAGGLVGRLLPETLLGAPSVSMDALPAMGGELR